MNLLNNITENFSYLQRDFIGFTFSLSGVGQVFLHLLIAAVVFIVFYFLGKKIYQRFFTEKTDYSFFINIVLGYIVVGTGIGLLGLFSLLQTTIILGYLLLIIFIAFYPFTFRFRKLLLLQKKIAKQIVILKKDIVVWGVMLFILIAFLRLITPEITEDAYHTDLPRLYLSTGTSVHEARDPLRVIPYPQLAESIYLIPIFLGDKEATRFIHFGFYLLIILLLFFIAKKKEFSFVRFAPLLFVTAPIMIRYSPSQYVDFFMVFSFMLALVLIEKSMSKKQIILSGIILGSVLSVKLWTFVYVPAVLIYLISLNKGKYIVQDLKKSAIFVIAVVCVPLLWYVRSFVITGNPIYPIFSRIEYLEPTIVSGAIDYRYFGFNANMFALENMIVYSPFFFLGVLFFIFYFNKIVVQLKRFPLAVFFVILMAEQLIVKVDLGRYLVAWYTIAVVIISTAVAVAYKNGLLRFGLVAMYLIYFGYYFVNTIFTLPYGFGWADQNAYLTRVLGRDNASYYNFDKLFDKWITERDVVATYGIFGYYYANFSYIDINYIFSQENRSIALLKERGVTKILIKGGDFVWFCKQLSLTGCKPEQVQLLATYPADLKKYNLYLLQY